MKRAAQATIFLFLCLGCHQPAIDLNSTRKGLADSAKKQNRTTVNWEKTYLNLENKSLDSPLTVISSVTKLIGSHNYSGPHVSDLYFLMGNIYYRIDSFSLAVRCYSDADPRGDGPKYLAARAGAYVKQKMRDSALADLIKAANANGDYKWNLGNYYEIIGKKDSALANYRWLYHQDSVVYAFCNERIHALEARHPRLLTELVYRNRDRMVLLLK